MWDRKYENKNDLVRVVTHEHNQIIDDRPLIYGGVEYIRDSKAILILEKLNVKYL